ncbi:Voltage-dependent anion-selective channel protein 1 [Stylosanthes scabra]|uniref:Voltage-dependent anion-selective channel protein 1 n=1 Tax=Stylosanthes scabra TaxID=79078 RepID=A0ABU6T898_9FABA|nr:Voltage-dependent anion-selective channel protein 1 [Stylosanthes scabra]
MAKGPGLYTEIGKKARDLLFKDYHSDQKFSISTYSPTGVAITSSGTRKGELFVADVNTQLKNRNVTTDIKVDTDSNLFTTITVDEPTPGLKAIFSFKVPDQRSGKVELQYLHDYAGVSTSVGLTANPIVNLSAVVGTNVLALGVDLSYDTKSGDLIKSNSGLSFTKDDLIAALNVNDKGDTLNASYYHVVNPLTSTAVGAEVTHRFSSNENTLTLGTQHALDPLTTVKARVNNYGRASALIQHEWRPKSLFTISGEVDTKAIEKSAKLAFGNVDRVPGKGGFGVKLPISSSIHHASSSPFLMKPDPAYYCSSNSCFITGHPPPLVTTTAPPPPINKDENALSRRVSTTTRYSHFIKRRHSLTAITPRTHPLFGIHHPLPPSFVMFSDGYSSYYLVMDNQWEYPNCPHDVSCYLPRFPRS